MEEHSTESQETQTTDVIVHTREPISTLKNSQTSSFINMGSNLLLSKCVSVTKIRKLLIVSHPSTGKGSHTI